MKLRNVIGAILLAVLSVAGTAAAQDTLAQAKTLYAAAAYDDALKLLDAAGNIGSQPEAKQYRALCLIALGRNTDAEREVAGVVEADPFFMPNGEEVAPRVVAMFADIRRKLLPPIIRSTFGDAKRRFQDNDKDSAREEFERVLRLLDDPVLAGNADLADLKIVASGFVDLTRSAPPPAPRSNPVTPPPVAPVIALAPPTTSQIEPVAQLPMPVIPPVAIQQALPDWRPRDPSAVSREFSGAVKVLIDATGKVTAATIERSIHPEYDRLVLASAQRWSYRPASRGGVAITSEKIVEIRLRTR